MTTSLWCLLAVALIPSVLSFVGGYYRQKELGKVDNKHPRQQYAQMTGTGARVYAAQQNAWEALILFTAGLFAANAAGVPAADTATVALVFVAARILHAVFYIANKDILRSLSYLVALLSVICLFVQGA